MSDYTAVAPPQNLSSGFDPSSAFADALQRARQIAAKINTPTGESTGGGSKRPLEDSQGMEWIEKNPPKKAALTDPFGAQLAAMQQQQRLGVNSTAVVTEEFHVPDKMVGLIIGRGGEQITRLQADSGCKIQMAADSGGLPDRSCSLTGTRQAVEKAKEMIMDIVSRGTARPMDSGPLPDGLSVVEMMIPASKVGLIIGKGGETIKNLQERAGVKMVMIQDSQFGNMGEKPLQIKGDPQKAEYARQLVLDLLTERELEVSTVPNMTRTFSRNPNQTNEYGSSQSGTQEVPVPRQAVGVVIGKGGEMIKKIQQDTGARVQFQQDDGPGERDRMCYLSGSTDQIQNAQGIIHDLINSVLTRDQQNMGRGRGRGRGGFDERRGGGAGGGGGPGRGGDFMGGGPMGRGGGGGPGNRNNQDWMEVTYNVPATKCGIIIGKGGETIKSINQVTGAHVELSRNQPPNPAEKSFVIRGLPNQIDHVKQLINEKIGGNMSGSSGTPPVNNYGMPSGSSQPPQGGPGYPMSGQQPGPGGGYAPQGWGGAYQQPWPSQPVAPGGNDMNKQAQADANAAAWAAYYAQYYGQVQAGNQPVAGAPASQAQPPASGQASGANQVASAGQPDYSAAWIEYYRSLGMYREADMVEQQARSQQGQAQPPVSFSL
ncbi:Far upstream element-binding protein 1 [Chamberlinius hualienensis]